MWQYVLIQGAISGVIYALIAIGFALIYGICGISNLTQGAYFMIGPFIYGVLKEVLPNYLPNLSSNTILMLALILSCLITAIIGSIVYRITLHPILGQEVNILILSICVCIIFQQLVLITMGPGKAFMFNIGELLPGMLAIGNVEVSRGKVFAAFFSILLFIALAIVIKGTKIGKAMRALSEDLEAAMLMGINVEKIFMLISGIAAVLASLGGIFYITTTNYNVSLWMWLQGLALAFTGVVLGGLKSLKGALVGGLIFGYAETIIIKVLPKGGLIIQSFPFIITILVLLIRPKGIFGKRIEME